MSAMKVGAGVCLLLVINGLIANAQKFPDQRQKAIWAPPDVLDLRDVAPKPTIKNEIINSLRVAGFRITLEETDLDRASKHFGAPVGAEGDASTYASWICLHGQGPQGHWALWLLTSEISGPKIDRINWQLIEPGSRLDRRCKSLGSGDNIVNLPIPIKLGMTESDVIATWGKPSDRYKKTAEYFHEHRLRIHGEPYVLLNLVEIVYRDGKVSAIVADHGTQRTIARRIESIELYPTLRAMT